MSERDRALRPLEEARSSIDRLTTYESPAALQEALRATWHAVESALRQLLRSDPDVPDELRLQALSRTEMTTDQVVTELRRRDLISLQLAGQVHQLSQAVERSEAGAVRAADADAALEAVEALERELSAGPAVAEHPRAARASNPVAAEPEFTVAERGRRRMPAALRRPVVLVGVAALLLAAVIALVLLFGRPDELQQGVAAFRANRHSVAEQHFRAALQRDEGSITARLYLARILREQQRYEESANLLREAARRSPQDAAVRRELGYLFLALNRPEQAAAQFRHSVELEPDETLGWVWLVQSLRRANDPAAELWLSRAPAAAQAMLRTGRTP
jgi:tetratricopeptide (TPR) repeat protein